MMKNKFSVVVIVLVFFIGAQGLKLVNAFTPNHITFDRPILYKGILYEAKSFNDFTAQNGIQNLVFIPSETVGEINQYYFAFSSIEETIEFTEKKGIGPSSSVESANDILPSENISNLEQGYSGCVTQIQYRYHDGYNCTGNSLSTSIDLSNLSSIGSGWAYKISSLANGPKSLILYTNINFTGYGLYVPPSGTSNALGSGFDNNTQSMDFYPFNPGYPSIQE